MNGRPNLPGLTGLRFFAAAAVVLYHLQILPSGYIGVSLFFVISGFILTYTYADSKFSIRSFWWARVARVYPLYITAFAFAAIVNVRHVTPEVTLAVLLSPIFLHAWVPAGLVTVVNPPAWTLCAEALFYLLFPVLLVRLSRQRRSLPAVLGLTWVVCLVGPLVYLVFRRPDFYDVVFGYVRIAPIFHLPQFLIGMIACLLWLAGRQTPARPVLAAMAMSLVLVTIGQRSYDAGLTLIANNGLLAPLFAAVLMSVASSPPRWLTSRPLILLGEASYAIYLLQWPELEIRNWAMLHLRVPALPANLLFVAVLLASSVAALYLIEKPGRRMLRARFGVRRPALLPVQASR